MAAACFDKVSSVPRPALPISMNSFGKNPAPPVAAPTPPALTRALPISAMLTPVALNAFGPFSVALMRVVSPSVMSVRNGRVFCPAVAFSWSSDVLNRRWVLA